MSEKLNVFGKKIHFDNAIEKETWHTYQPYGSNNYNYSDEIRILIQSQDLITNTSESYLYIEGKITETEDAKTFDLTNNFACFLFEEIRYELGGQKVDVCRLPGITSAIKGYASYTKSECAALTSAGWQPFNDTPLQVQFTVNAKQKNFSVLLPLKHVLGIFEDYPGVIINMRQELVLIRSRTDLDSYTGNTTNAKIEITKINWRVQHVTPSDEMKIKLFDAINKDSTIKIPFRQGELYELSALKQAKSDIWVIKTSTQLEKPRYMLTVFQKNKRNKMGANAADFNNSNITNLKAHLNSESYPYENWNLDFNNKKYMPAYHSYCNFQKNYYSKSNAEPLFNYNQFDDRPIFVIDCSKQKETMKTSTVDIKLEMESLNNFENGTTAFCLILHDCIVEYNPLTGEVRRV